jgi:apolipoprotein N-acyltransferase
MDSAFFEALYAFITVISLGGTLFYANRYAKRPIRTWFLFGLLFNLFSLSFFYSAYPLTWFGGSVSQLLGITLFIVSLALLAGISYAIVGYAFGNSRSWKEAFLFAFLCALAEILRSLLFSLLLSGNGGKVGLHYDAGTVGGALSVTPFIEYAFFGGVYALTAVFALLVYIGCNWKLLRFWYVGIGLLVCGVFFIHQLPMYTPGDLTLGIVTTNDPNPLPSQDLNLWRTEKHARLLEATQALAKQKVDLIIYPEDADMFARSTDAQITTLREQFPQAVFVDGTTAAVGSGYSNFSTLYEPAAPEKVQGRGKTFLFPFSEYVPTLLSPVVKILLGNEAFAQYAKDHHYLPFSDMTVFSHEGIRIGTLVCSELSSFQIVHSLVHLRPDIIIGQANLAVFHGNPWFGAQYRSYTKIAAAQSRTFFISDANMADTLVISPYGKVLKTIRSSTTESFVVHGW